MEASRGHRIPGAGVVGGCSLPAMDAETELGSLGRVVFCLNR